MAGRTQHPHTPRDGPGSALGLKYLWSTGYSDDGAKLKTGVNSAVKTTLMLFQTGPQKFFGVPMESELKKFPGPWDVIYGVLPGMFQADTEGTTLQLCKVEVFCVVQYSSMPPSSPKYKQEPPMSGAVQTQNLKMEPCSKEVTS